MGLSEDTVHRMLTDDDDALTAIARGQGDCGRHASRAEVALVGALVDRLRERLRTQGEEGAALEQGTTVLEARLAALEQQLGR